jgi:hypothetical protein
MPAFLCWSADGPKVAIVLLLGTCGTRSLFLVLTADSVRASP